MPAGIYFAGKTGNGDFSYLCYMVLLSLIVVSPTRPFKKIITLVI
jgi:hypothetical protein